MPTLSERDSIYPFEFYIPGTPKSLQASAGSKNRWKEQIREAARERTRQLTDFPFIDNRPLAVTLYYFPAARMDGDVDNIVKPIVDALEGMAYLEDRAIDRVVVQKFEPEVDWRFDGPSQQLAGALDTVAPVVYIRVDDDLSWRTL